MSIDEFNAEADKTLNKTKLLGSSFKSLGKSILNTVANIGLNMAASAAISFVISKISELISYQKDLAQSAQQMGDSFKQTESSIKNTQSKVQEYVVTLQDESATVEEVAAARQGLLDIRSELISQYPEEQSSIQMITDLLNGETVAVEDLSRAFTDLAASQFEAQKRAYNKENGSGWKEFFYGYDEAWDGVERNMENAHFNMNEFFYSAFGSLKNKDALDKYKELSSKYNVAISQGTSIGNAYDIQNMLKEYLSYVDSELAKDPENNYFEKLKTNISSALGDVESTISQYGNLYDSEILYEKIYDDGKLKQYYADIIDAKNDYDKAMVSGNTSTIDEAGVKLLNLRDQMEQMSSDSGIQHIFEDIFKPVELDLNTIKFNKEFDNTTSNLRDSIEQIGDVLSDFSTDELKSFEKSLYPDTTKIGDAYSKLESYAKEYGVSIDLLIDKLEKLGKVDSLNTRTLKEKFGSDNVDRMSDAQKSYLSGSDGQQRFDYYKSQIEATRKLATNAIQNFQKEYNKTTNKTIKNTASLNTAIKKVEKQNKQVAKTANYSKDLTPVMKAYRNVEEQAKSLNMTVDEFLNYYNPYNAVSSQEDLTNAVTKTIAEYERLQRLEFDTKDRTNMNNVTAAEQGESLIADYNKMTQDLKTAKELLNKGQIGDPIFKAIAKEFSVNGFDDYENFIENSKYLGKYFTEGSTGIETFVNDLKTNGFAEWDDNLKKYNLDLKDMKGIAEKMHMPLEMLTVLLQGLGEYGFTNDYFGNMGDAQKHLTNLYKELADKKAQLAKLEADNEDGHNNKAIKDLKADIDDLHNSINTTIDGMNQLLTMNSKSLADEYKAAEAAAQAYVDELNNLDENDPAYSFIKQSLENALSDIEQKYGIKIEVDDNGGVKKVKHDVEDLKQQADSALDNLQTFRDVNGKLNLDDSEVKEAYDEYEKLRLAQLEAENPIKLNVDRSTLNNETDKFLSDLQEKVNRVKIQKDLNLNSKKAENDLHSFFENNKELAVSLGVTSGNYDQLIKQLENNVINVPLELRTNSNIDIADNFASNSVNVTANITNKQDLEDFKTSVSNIPPDKHISVNCEVPDYATLKETQEILSTFPDAEGTITLNGIDYAINKEKILIDNAFKINKNPISVKANASGNANTVLQSILDKHKELNGKTSTTYVNTVYKTTGSPIANKISGDTGRLVDGSAHADGTLFSPQNALRHQWAYHMGSTYGIQNGAYTGGNWGLPHDETALVGEVKPELLVNFEPTCTAMCI